MASTNAENIIEKLRNIENTSNVLDTWSLEEKKQLLNIYHIISKKESAIFDLIYSNHGCDSWEDIFRDYDRQYLKDKASGVNVAITTINKKLKST